MIKIDEEPNIVSDRQLADKSTNENILSLNNALSNLKLDNNIGSDINQGNQEGEEQNLKSLPVLNKKTSLTIQIPLI